MLRTDPPFGTVVATGSARVADRRRNTATLVSAVASGASIARSPRAARERLEEELCRALQARMVVLRDDPGMRLPPAANTICIEVPSGYGETRARLEVVFDAPRPLDAWTCQLMEAAAQLATLVLELERASGRAALLKKPVDGAAPFVGSSEAIRRVRERIERVAVTDFTVLIEGESGSGKELVARQIHDLSRRRRGPFVAVNCAAIVETLIEAELFGIEERTATGVRGRRGKFENAHEGTLFLDEVSDLSPAAQAKLLRAIQDLSIERVGGYGVRRVDTRIVVATNRPLASLVADGRFRMDLYYRLHGVEVQVPPLRERREDVVELAQYFLERHRGVRALQLSEAATDALVAYHWPG
ncbi:MAG: sigma 54-interacting transcriptional regulator, partial [Vicinamibacterales bacterium]